MKDKFLVIDIGTQSIRASIVSKNGKIIDFVQKEYEQPYFSPKKGWAEQDPDYYIKKLCLVTNELKRKSRSDYSELLGMVIVAFRDTSVILDKDKKVIRPSILWLDQRVTLLHGKNFKPHEKLLFRVIGMKDAVTYNAERTPAWWIKRNEPENWKKMRYYTPLTGYFNYVLTGNLVVSSADCIGHYPINFKKGKWFPTIHPKVDVFGIPMDKVPQIVKPGSIIGYISNEFSKCSGIPAGLTLYASGSDKACETFGNGCIENDEASISLGTACTIDVVNHVYKEPEAFLPSYPTPYQGSFDYEIQIYRGLWMIRWFAEQFGKEDINAAKREGLTIEEYLNKMIQTIPCGSDGLVLQPYWGAGLKRPNAKGTILGFSAVHTRFHLYRAIIEGITFALREGYDEIYKKTHKKLKFITISGGGAKSDIFAHIIADVFGIEVRRNEILESSTLGGAMSGFIFAGVYKDERDAKDHMVKVKEIIQPDLENHKIYDDLYKKVYLRIYPSLKKTFVNIKHFYLKENGED